jgi:hypothetical protein
MSLIVTVEGKMAGDFTGDLRHGAFPRIVSALAPGHAKALTSLKLFSGRRQLINANPTLMGSKHQ